MPWTVPNYPTSGTTITRAYAVTNLIDPLNWLRALAGGADPPAADYVVVSTGASSSSWQKVGTAALADNGVTTAKILDLNVTTAKIADSNVTTAKVADGAITTAKVADGAITAVKLGLNAAVPSGAVVWFELLAELTAAGAGWARYTAANGRLLVGDGVTFGQTFTAATVAGHASANYGANWTPSSGLSVPASVQDPGHEVIVSGPTPYTTVSTNDHVHPAQALPGATTPWLPPMRAGFFGRKS